MCISVPIVQAGKDECAMRGGRGEVLCKSEKKKWRVRLGEEKSKGK